MKPEEAIEILELPKEPLKSGTHYHAIPSPKRISYTDYLNARKAAVEALEKQVPKKVKNIRFSRDRELAEHNIKEGECPECGETMTGNTFGYYCGCCGVALDWGYEE